MTTRCASEHQEQAALFAWWTLQADPDCLPLLFAIPNGGARDRITGARLKAEGVRPGAPDMFLACPRNGKAGLWIELKRQAGGRVSDAQKNMLGSLARAGYEAVVCHGWLEARRAICQYLGWTP